MAIGFTQGLERSMLIGCNQGKGRLYNAPLFRILLMTNKEIILLKNGYVITMDHWKPHLEAMALVLIWMAMTPSFMMMKRVPQRVTLTRRNTKDYQIPLIYTTSEKKVAQKYQPIIITNILWLKLCYLIVMMKNKGEK